MGFQRLLRSRSSDHGFTLLELLVVVLVIGIVAAILIPNLLDALHKSKQKRTVDDMRGVGRAWFSWLTDQLGAAPAGATTFDFNFGTVIDATMLETTLFPSSTFFHIETVPMKDGWGNDYEYRLDLSQLLGSQFMAIRSAGRDGSFASSAYTVGPFVATAYDLDIVWADGFFVRYPSGAQVEAEPRRKATAEKR